MSVKHNAGQVADAIARLPQSVTAEMDGALANAAADIVREAKERAPYNTSTLKTSISQARITLLEHHITAAAEYASFREYGTGPGGWAIDQGPDGKVSFDRLLDWIRRKDITPREGTSPRSLAYLIARKIAREGTPATPYMEPAFDAVAPKLDARLRASVARGIANVAEGRAL